MRSGMDLRVGDWVEIRSIDEIRATLDGEGELEHLPFMPEMAPHCGRRAQVAAVMPKICGGGRGMKGILGDPLVILDDLRCDGAAHGNCSRACTLLWKPSWLRLVGRDRPGLDEGRAEGTGSGDGLAWPYPTKTESGAYLCQATALPRATVPISTLGKVLSAFHDVHRGEWSLASLAKVYLETLSHRVSSWLRRVTGKKKTTPVEKLGLRPGEWVQVKSLDEISATLDRNGKNRGLEFSRYMIPFCGGTYRVLAQMENFINEWTGEMRKLENTVLLQGVSCGGETTSGPCRRAEYLYWREVWLRRVEAPVAENRDKDLAGIGATRTGTPLQSHARVSRCARPCAAHVPSMVRGMSCADSELRAESRIDRQREAVASRFIEVPSRLRG
jgi:hypothetical protein